MQRKIPYVTEAHVGFFALQSKQVLFSDLDLSFLKKAFLSVEISEAMASERERESGVPRG